MLKLFNIFKSNSDSAPQKGFNENKYLRSIKENKFKDKLLLGYTDNYEKEQTHLIQAGSNTFFQGSMGSGKSVAGNFVLSTLALSHPHDLIIIYDRQSLSQDSEYISLTGLNRTMLIGMGDDLEEALLNFILSEIQARDHFYDKNKTSNFSKIILNIDLFDYFLDKISKDQSTLDKFIYLMRIARRYRIVINCIGNSIRFNPNIQHNFCNNLEFKLHGGNPQSFEISKRGQAILNNKTLVDFPFDISNKNQYPLINKEMELTKSNEIKLASISPTDFQNFKQNTHLLKNISYPATCLEFIEFWNFIDSGVVHEDP